MAPSDGVLEFNLCDLLGIDIEAKALAIALADREQNINSKKRITKGEIKKKKNF